MTDKEHFFELEYGTDRVHEYSKIYPDDPERAKKEFNSIDEYKWRTIGVSKERFLEIREEFKPYYEFYKRYYNKSRERLFSDSDALLKWLKDQGDGCYYCKTTQKELFAIVKNRNGNLTLNNKSKRSGGVLEIEKKDPEGEYTLDNSVLACPFCNNAKSNLISEEDWHTYFKDAMTKYLKKESRI